MKKTIPHVLAFVLGFIVCALVLRQFYGFPIGASAPMQPVSVRPAPPIASAGSKTVSQAAAVVAPEVVNIDTRGQARAPGFPFDIFGFPFGEAPPAVPVQGTASGVIIRSDGYILTNNHVVADAQSMTVTLHDGRKYSGKVVGTDASSDLAVIRINARSLPAARFGDSDNLVVGDWVLAIGNALGLGPTVTVGVVSATQRALEIGGRTLENAIQTDAAINRGNSGGALADLNGAVIGINTAIASTSPGGGNIGIGFAIPSNTAKKIADQLISKGRVVRPWLGIYYTPVTENIRQALASQGPEPPSGGVIVSQVVPGSPAEKAGIRPYDVILEINKRRVKSDKTVADEIRKQKAGQKILLLIWRGGQRRLTGVTLGEMPPGVG
ncbi:MAG: trypsin-like peptidase domain-containing protein [Armatimonadota bacterium]|nr:trypsin-like peptidase domain-containing protein [Armatimonadota bacterium]